VRFLGTETGLPGGLEQWAQLRGPGRALGGVLFDLRAGEPGNSLRGAWRCRSTLTAEGPPGYRPGPERAELESALRLPEHQGRAVFTVWASGSDDWLRVDERELSLHRGRNDAALPLHVPNGVVKLSLRASPGAFIELIGLVPRSPDVPLPAPEPEPHASAGE
jgi:hypothetical protein